MKRYGFRRKTLGRQRQKRRTRAIKHVGMEGLVSEYSWAAQVKGMRRAKGVDGNIHVTAIMKSLPKGVTKSKDQGIFMTVIGDMGVLKGLDMMKMTAGRNPTAVGLWSFMTMSQRN